MSLSLVRQFPTLSEDEIEALSLQVFAAAKRMSNDQLLDLADGLHDILRTRQAITRRREAEPASFAAGR
jgi:hypothetical protein